MQHSVQADTKLMADMVNNCFNNDGFPLECLLTVQHHSQVSIEISEISSVESQKVVIAAQRCSVEN